MRSVSNFTVAGLPLRPRSILRILNCCTLRAELAQRRSGQLIDPGGGVDNVDLGTVGGRAKGNLLYFLFYSGHSVIHVLTNDTLVKGALLTNASDVLDIRCVTLLDKRKQMKILIIGGGNMGQTYARSLLRAHLVSQEDLMILERQGNKATALEDQKLGTIYTDSSTCLQAADLIILAVKPQDSAVLFESLRPDTDPQQVYLSIMAGVTIEAIQRGLGVAKVIRAMPNLPAQIGLGMTCLHR